MSQTHETTSGRRQLWSCEDHVQTEPQGQERDVSLSSPIEVPSTKTLPSPQDQLAAGANASLYETVPNFEETWTEYLKDLCRYRIEDDDIRDREVWTSLSTRFSNGLTDYRVEAIVGKHRVGALADTGAQSNFISVQLVEKLGLTLDNGIPKTTQLPGGKQLLSLGTVKVPFSSHGELEEYMLDCWVIPGCTSDLILSGPFLRATKTLTTFTNRTKEPMHRSFRTQLRFNLVGNERQRLWGSLNGRSALALPDTGSDVMLASAKWVKENKLVVDDDLGHRLKLELADGSRVFTSGIVHDVMWTFGDSTQEVCCDFYVLDDLRVDIVFSNDFIFKLDVFSRFCHLTIDLDSTCGLSEFYIDEALDLQSRIARLHRPDKRVFKVAQNELWGGTLGQGGLKRNPIVGEKTRDYLDAETDLISLKLPVENDPLTRMLRALWPGKEEGSRDGLSRVSRFDERSIPIAVVLINIIVAIVLLVGPVTSLSFVNSRATILGMICTFTIVFAFSGGLMTSAKRAEIFAGSVAYAAVLVVFVGNGDLSGSNSGN
ncbi:hypothetical protein FGRMN_6936 [Fusarium graminum]|nr:hypothetical protein FGRMN_6936 [Fusarium graminum]